ncbi:MAG: hypothetical protein H8D23_26445 [Candidatus Brocadiales bacterium]|nr:hypothetical protein [Candidatus Brocadiales bacterium]
MMRIKAVTPAQQTGGQAVTALQKTTHLHITLNVLKEMNEFVNNTIETLEYKQLIA